MNVAAATGKSGSPNGIVLAPPVKAADTVFRFVTWVMAMMVVVLAIMVGCELFSGAHESMHTFGWAFFLDGWHFHLINWNPVNGHFGAAAFIFGTFISSLLGLLIALPISLGTAIYLTELAPGWIRQTAMSLIEMLAAIPSVVYGLWGIFVMVPWLRDYPFKFLKHHFGFLPFFSGPVYGPCILAAGVIIAIMIVPIITSISREVFRAVPDSQREAAFALGATRWEVTRLAVLRYSSRGIFGAAMLGLGRALGETMAVLMVIGNSPEISKSFFAQAETLAGAIALEFNEAVSDLHTSALFELGLMLLLVTIITNILAQLLMGAVAAPRSSGN